MKMNKKINLLIVLGGFAVVSVIYGIVSPAKRDSVVGRAVPLQPPSEAAPSLESFLSLGPALPGERQAKRGRYALWGRNPFVSTKGPVPETPAPASVILNGIAWDEKTPRAVINNRIVRPGDRVQGNEVIRIEKDRAVLSNGVREFELRLGKKR